MIDASIPLGFRPPQVESPLNALAQYSQIQGLQNQNKLASMGLQERQRAIDDEANLSGLMRNALNPSTGEVDPAKLNSLIAEKGTYGQMTNFQKQQLDHKKIQSAIDKDAAETQEKKFKIAKEVYGLMGDAAGAIEQDPTYENAVRITNRLKMSLPADIAKGITTDDIPRTPEEIRKWAANHKRQVISADKQQEDERMRSEGAAGRAVTMRGQNMTASTAAAGRAQSDRHFNTTQAAGKVPAGYRANADGSMSYIPGGPADPKAGVEAAKRSGEARDVLGLLDEVDTLLPKSTGSYAGAGIDAALGAFGASTAGAQATAQLKALQGALVAKMPKMSGPQSDKDVMLYREMAGQVGDPTIPVKQRQAASTMIRKLNEKYAGMPEGASNKQPNAPTPALPSGWSVKEN